MRDSSDQYEDINSLSSYDYKNENDSTYISLAYDLTFKLILNIISGVENIDERNKEFTILNAILKNIVDHPDEEKFRKLKLSNKNIESLFNIEGVYDFFAFLGFEEKYTPSDNELYLILIIGTIFLSVAL